MADLGEIYSATLKGSGVDLPPNQIETIAASHRPQSTDGNSLPPNFISFYNNVVGFINQYEKAFEEENFERMKFFIVAVSEAISNYFKKTKKNGDDELQAELNGIAEDTATIAQALIKQKQMKSFSEDELQERIFNIVAAYKEKILNKIKGQVASLRASDKTNTAPNGPKPADNAITATIDSANEVLQKKDSEYQTEIEKFSIRLGSIITHEFKDNIKKLNEYNLRTFEKGINRLDTAYANHFYNIVTQTNESISKSQGKLKAGFSKIGRVLKYSAITMTNTVTLAISGLTYAYLGGKLFVKTLWFWGGKVLAPVKYLLGLGLRLVKGAINFAFKAVKFVVNGVYTTGKFLVKTTFRVLNKTYSLAMDIWKKVFGFSFWEFVKGTVSAFIFSYPGAYFLGYLSGKIWGGILRLAGLSDEDIRNGNYHIKDDVLMPLFETIKGKITGIFGEGSNLFSKWKDKLTDKGAGLLEEFKQTKVYQRIESLKAKIAPTWKHVIEQIKPFVQQVKEFYNNYVEPVVGALASILSVFGDGLIEAPQMFLRSRYGAMVGLVKSSAYFAKHIRLRGGIAGIIASAIAIGAGMILGTNTKKETQDNGEADNPLKMPIASKFAFLYGGSYNVEDEKEFSEYEGYRTAIQRKEEVLGKLLQQAHSMPKETKELSREYYNRARYAYAKIQGELDFANSSELLLKDLLTEYRNDSGNNREWKASDYKGIVDLLRYNDKYIIDPSSLDNLSPLAQIGLLNAIVLQRKARAQDELDTFKALAEGENGLANVARYFEGIDERFLKVKTFVGGDLDSAANTLDYKFELALNDIEDTYADYQNDFLRGRLRENIGKMNASLMRTQIMTRTDNVRNPEEMEWTGWGASKKKAEAQKIWDMAINEDLRTAHSMGYSGSISDYRASQTMPTPIDITGTFDPSQFANKKFQNTLTYVDHIANAFQDSFMDMLRKNESYKKHNNSFNRLNILMRQQIDATIKSITTEDLLKENGEDLLNIGYNVFARALNSIEIQESENGINDLKELVDTLKGQTNAFKETLMKAVGELNTDRLMTKELLKEANAYISELNSKK